jgi:hypothetical protein
MAAWVAASKYLDHLPLYQIEQIAARQGVPLARSTLAQWIGRIGVALQPLANRLGELLRQRTCLHADETPVRQLDPGSGTTRQAYLWASRSGTWEDGPAIVVFDYQPSRAGAHARAFLKDWRGHLMVNDYAGYKALFAQGPTELACLAHIRRKFFDLHAANGSSVTEEALRRIAQLYAIEQGAAGMQFAGRLAKRQEHAVPALAAMHAWLLTTQRSAASPSARHGQGHRACPQALDGAGALRQLWHSPDRQQPGRERDPTDRHRQEELAICRLRASWPPCRSHPEPVCYGQAQWTGSGLLASRHPRQTADLPEQQDRFAAAIC